MRKKLLLTAAAMVLSALLFLAAAENLSDGSSSAAVMQLEETLRKAAAACYAADGTYPMSLEDLENRCGIQINRQRYAVHYEIFAANRMPSITVLEKKE